MTDTTTAVDTAAVPKKKESAGEGVDAELVGRLVEQARVAGLQLTGEGGLLQQLTRRVIEAALDGKFTDHLGYAKHDPAGKNRGNSRNGARVKTVLTDVGPVEIRVPRGRPVVVTNRLTERRHGLEPAMTALRMGPAPRSAPQGTPYLTSIARRDGIPSQVSAKQPRAR
jgi:putative transposase